MEIITKQEVSDRNLFEKNTYMLVGCYLEHEFLPIFEKHIFVVPVNMFQKEQLLSQWIYENNYYTKSKKVDIPKAVNISIDNTQYAVLPENIPLEIREVSNNDENLPEVEWEFIINEVPIGCVLTENIRNMKYTFYYNNGWTGEELFNSFKLLREQMEEYDKEIHNPPELIDFRQKL